MMNNPEFAKVMYKLQSDISKTYRTYAGASGPLQRNYDEELKYHLLQYAEGKTGDEQVHGLGVGNQWWRVCTPHNSFNQCPHNGYYHHFLECWNPFWQAALAQLDDM